MSDSPAVRPALALAGFRGATFLVAGVSTLFTTPSIPTWYAGLNKPSFNPPNDIFAPVWTTLYILMAIAAWLVWKQPPSAERSRGLQLFWIQLALNFAWSLIFFQLHLIGFALAGILMLWLAILATCLAFFGVSKPAGVLLLPYLAWVSFASLLNFEIWRLN